MRILLLAFIFSLITLFTACAEDVGIVHGLTEFEANEVLVILASQEITGSKAIEEGRIVSYAINVSAADSNKSLEILVKNHLPRIRVQGLAEVYAPGNSGLIPTQSEEKAKYLMAIQGELVKTLMTLPSIQTASVSIAIPDKDVVRDLDKEPVPTTASATVIFKADEDGHASITKEDVQELIGAGVEELDAKNVKVLMVENKGVLAIVGDTNQNGGADVAAVKVVGEKVLGIMVAKKSDVKKARFLFGVFGVVAALALLAFIFALFRSMGFKKRVVQLETDLMAQRKMSRREM